MSDGVGPGERPGVAVLGGAVAGLAAAERFRSFAAVDLYERQSYDDKRVNCGEAINEASLIPLDPTPENGFLNPVDGFDVEFYRSTDRTTDADPMVTARIDVAEGYVTDRDVVERRWADRLRASDHVTVHENANVSVARYEEIVDEYDYVVDATGQPSLTTKARGETDAYTGEIVALNADVEGDFAAILDHPRIVVEGYLGYFWVFPKTAERANVGIGWSGDSRPDDYMRALREACDRAGVPSPDREATNVYTIPQGPSLHPDRVARDDGVFLVGDAAGIANRYQGEGICQAVRSSYLLADLVEAGEQDRYPEQLYESMKSEFRLARLMRGMLEETDDVELVADIATALEGLTVDDVTRHPRRVYARLARRPRLLVRLLGNGGLRRRLRTAYRDRWEFGPADSRAI